MRVAIVNDVRLAVEALRRVIEAEGKHQIAWVALDGAEAVRRCGEDRPDLILMDLLMPVMDGVEATRHIMSRSPTAIVIVTATIEGNASQVFRAMGFGALDAVNTPLLGLDGSAQGGKVLLEKIGMIANLVGKSDRHRPRAAISGEMALVKDSGPPLVVIGASTGGPQALAEIFAAISSPPEAAIVVVQHVDVQFAPGLARWLQDHSKFPIGVAVEGAKPQPGTALLAATNDHLILSKHLTFQYTPEPQAYSYRPSVDVFFESLAARWPGRGIAVLLTGMGRDGGQGLLSLRKSGWHTIAQDEATSVIYGMPRAAAELKSAMEILPLSSIAASIDLHVKRLRLSAVPARRPEA